MTQQTITEDRMGQLYMRYINHAGKNPIVRFQAGYDDDGLFIDLDYRDGSSETLRVEERRGDN